jgi:hypothetical protein
MMDVVIGLAGWVGLNVAVVVALAVTSFWESKGLRTPEPGIEQRRIEQPERPSERLPDAA